MRSALAQPVKSAKKDSVFSGEAMNIVYRSRKLLTLKLWRCGSNRVGRRWQSSRHHEILEAGRRKYKKVMIRSGAGIAEFVRNVTRRNKGVARLENEHLISDGDFQFSGSDVVGFVLACVRVAWYADSRCEAHLQKAVCSSCILA